MSALRVYEWLLKSNRTLGSSVYVPGMSSVEETLHVSEEVALIPFSLFFLGQAFAPFLTIPISETLGRRGTYLPYMLLFLGFTLGAGFSPTIASLCICRFLAGVFGTPAILVGFEIIADIWIPQERAIPTAYFVLLTLLGPSVG
jgi:MFS family permease